MHGLYSQHWAVRGETTHWFCKREGNPSPLVGLNQNVFPGYSLPPSRAMQALGRIWCPQTLPRHQSKCSFLQFLPYLRCAFTYLWECLDFPVLPGRRWWVTQHRGTSQSTEHQSSPRQGLCPRMRASPPQQGKDQENNCYLMEMILSHAHGRGPGPGPTSTLLPHVSLFPTQPLHSPWISSDTLGINKMLHEN